jgi:hypothetical protein
MESQRTDPGISPNDLKSGELHAKIPGFVIIEPSKQVRQKMKKSKSVGKKVGKNAAKASKTAKKAFKSGSKSLKKSLAKGAAALKKEVKSATPIVKKAVASGFEKAVHLTGEAAKLAKLKVEMAVLNNEKEKLQQELGNELWILYQQKRLDTVQQDLAEWFGKMEELEGRIAAKDAEIKAVSFD